MDSKRGKARFWKARDMYQKHKLICTGLSVFFAATHAGCAGSGLKNMFTRNETDGYHSLDELSVEERAVAEAEKSEDEEGAPTMVARLASWRPFGKAEPDEEPDEEEVSASGEALTSESDSDQTAKSPRLLGRAFSKRDSVEPDPFLGTEPNRSDGPEFPAFKTAADQKIAKTDNKPIEADDESSTEPDPIPDDSKDGDTDAVALGASREPSSASSNSEDEDNALTKRFEEHFQLNSVGTMAKTKANATAAGTDLKQKAATAARTAESRKLDRSSIADRQIDAFEKLLAAEPDHNGKNSGFRRNSEATPLKTSKSNDFKSENSFYAFDQLMSVEGSAASREASHVTHKATQSPKESVAAMNIEVADAEALFGAAAARQDIRTQHAEDAPRSKPAGHDLARSGTSSQTSDSSDRFQWNESRQAKPGSEPDSNREDVSSAFARHSQGNSGADKQRRHDTAFGIPTVSAGDVDGEDRSTVEGANIRLSNASASATGHRIVTANYGTVDACPVTPPVSTEIPAVGDTHFTAAPVAPVSDAESSGEVVSAATRPGLVQSFSTRNWLLLIGGIIVIALLFAPSRTKPLTMNGRPVNG